MIRIKKIFGLVGIVFLACLGPVWAQSPAQKPQTESAREAEKKEKPSFTLRITEENVIGISLKADKAKLSDVAAELSRKLKIPVVLSRVMQKQTVTTEYSELLLEPAMQLLAPIVFIDYEIKSAPGSKQRPLGIFLNAYNETPPAMDALVKGTSQAFVLSGNTEGDAADDEGPIHVSYRNELLTAKAKDQPLVDVLSDIADETEIPLEAPAESKELVTVDFKDRPVEEGVLTMSPNLRVYVRADLSRGKRTVLRIVVVEHEKKP